MSSGEERAGEGYGPLCSEFYELDKPVGGEYPDVGYYLRRLRGLEGRALEAAVGTGRLLVPLLEAGLAVDGVDSSEEMLERCRRNCAGRGLDPRLYTADLRDMELEDRYAAIILSCGSFALIEDRDEAAAALSNFARHLVPGGRLFVDLDASVGEPDEWNRSRSVPGEDGSEIVLRGSTGYDAAERLEVTLLRYERIRAGRVVQTEVQRLPVRRYERGEFETLLSAAGFTGVELRPDYREDRSGPVGASEFLCYSARLRGAAR